MFRCHLLSVICSLAFPSLTPGELSYTCCRVQYAINAKYLKLQSLFLSSDLMNVRFFDLFQNIKTLNFKNLMFVQMKLSLWSSESKSILGAINFIWIKVVSSCLSCNITSAFFVLLRDNPLRISMDPNHQYWKNFKCHIQ